MVKTSQILDKFIEEKEVMKIIPLRPRLDEDSSGGLDGSPKRKKSVGDPVVFERKITSTQEKKRKTKKAEEVTTAQKEADEIFERFKRGEKLSTEDLMALQKAGLI